MWSLDSNGGTADDENAQYGAFKEPSIVLETPFSLSTLDVI